MGMVADAGLEAARARVAKLPIWSGRVDPVPLGGGITNRNSWSRIAAAAVVVARRRRHPRSRRRARERARGEPGRACRRPQPAVVHAEPGILVLEFIEGATFKPEDVRDPRNLDRLVDLVRRCHRDVPRIPARPGADVLGRSTSCATTRIRCARAGSRHVPQLAGLLERAGAPREAAVGPIDVVFGHNDLLAANILDDGQRLWLLDWEYAGFNSPLFDLGGLASNSEMPREHSRCAARSLFRPAGRRCAPPPGRRHDGGLASARDACGAWCRRSTRTLAFDYAAYTAENLARFEAAYAQFETWSDS